jgi:hypothetical protein
MLNIGIVGAENSHTAAIAKVINVEKRVRGVRVTHVWGETKAFAEKAAAAVEKAEAAAAAAEARLEAARRDPAAAVASKKVAAAKLEAERCARVHEQKRAAMHLELKESNERMHAVNAKLKKAELAKPTAR